MLQFLPAIAAWVAANPVLGGAALGAAGGGVKSLVGGGNALENMGKGAMMGAAGGAVAPQLAGLFPGAESAAMGSEAAATGVAASAPQAFLGAGEPVAAMAAEDTMRQQLMDRLKEQAVNTGVQTGVQAATAPTIEVPVPPMDRLAHQDLWSMFPNVQVQPTRFPRR